MELNLTKEEAILLKQLLTEEIDEINDLAEDANEQDKKSLVDQIKLMNSIIEKLK